MSEKILELREVTKVFRTGLLRGRSVLAVDKVSFHLGRGEILGLLGESGSGKSTIAKIILKIYEPTSGKVLYRGRDVSEIRGWKELKQYYSKVQGVFQDPFSSFNPRRMIRDTFYDTIRNFGLARTKEEADAIIVKAVNTVGLNYEEVINKYPHEFSGGQLQRLSIARALLVNPEVIVADEPVSMVDASTRIDILNTLIDLKQNFGISVLLIGHDLSLMRYASDRVIVLYKGQVLEEGPASILEKPNHPYTRMLYEAVPRIEEKWSEKPRYAPELPASASAGARGCVFADRCPIRTERCLAEEPPFVTKDGARVKCWRV
uniref:ABC transporter ATP-binding protein n=1 Tax=Thermofilum pendens TaxID=2269 RepID=A0A7J3X785_THEPE